MLINASHYFFPQTRTQAELIKCLLEQLCQIIIFRVFSPLSKYRQGEKKAVRKEKDFIMDFKKSNHRAMAKSRW